MELKYVRHDTVGFVIWPRTDDIWHSHVGSLLKRANGKLVSAGFARLKDGKAVCYGYSETLDLSSQEDDSAALTKQLGL